MFKVCIFGDGGVGKTCLVNRYLTGIFKDDSDMTIGVDFFLKKLKIANKSISLQIWDFAGEERFRFILPSYLIGADGGIFMYDITRYSSLKNIDNWFEVLIEGSMSKKREFPIIMVGGKLDLDKKRAVSSNEAYSVSKKHDLEGFIECSSKNGQNIDEIFVIIARLMMERTGLI